MRRKLKLGIKHIGEIDAYCKIYGVELYRAVPHYRYAHKNRFKPILPPNTFTVTCHGAGGYGSIGGMQ